jgi:hypothetical protein
MRQSPDGKGLRSVVSATSISLPVVGHQRGRDLSDIGANRDRASSLLEPGTMAAVYRKKTRRVLLGSIGIKNYG